MPHITNNEIYIIGYSLRLPETDSAYEFHEHLVHQYNMVTRDERRWPIGYNQTPEYFGKLKQSLDYFDNIFFGIHGKQAEKLDPQLRLLLETSFEALIASGLTPQEIKGTGTGVYTGTCISDFCQQMLHNEHTINGYELTGSASSMYPNRLSYFYDLHGPSFNIDTACASSLSALHRAVQDIQHGKCDMAFVCGSTIILDPALTTSFNKLQMLSVDGFCKTFDQSANGFSRAEGVVSLLITSNSDYVRHVPHGKILASSTNTCGYNAASILYPNYEKQAQLYEQTLVQANLSPADINYIECHGTGTIAGDTAELLGIQKVWGDKANIRVGALKTNIGHTEGASGLAGLVKVLLSYETKVVYPQLHLKEKIPALGNLQPITEPQYEQELAKVIINSFGFGGVNVCVCIDAVSPESFPPKQNDNWHGLYFISSRTQEGLYSLKRELEKAPQQLLALQESNYLWREVVGLPDDLQLNPVQKRPLYFAFSGNGSQWQGMGIQLMQASDLFRHTLALCGQDIPELLINGWKGPLQDTLLLTAIQIALVELLKSLGIQADGYLAHSAGEIAASYASGATNIQETMAIARARGQAAEEMPYGLMLSVGLNQEEILPYLSQTKNVTIACINSPKNITLSGDATEITALKDQLQQEEKFVRELNTHGRPYHSSFIDKNNVYAHLKQAYPGVVERNNTWISAIEGYNVPYFSAEYHVESVVRPVNFNNAISQVPENALIVEIGPHAVLRALIREGVPSTSYVSLMTKDRDDLAAFKEGLGALWKLGVTMNTVTDSTRPSLLLRAKQTTWMREYFPLARVNYHSTTRSHVFLFDLLGKDAYLLDHLIDDKPLFPAMGFVYLMWQSYLRNNPQAKIITVDHFKILRGLPLIGEQVQLTVNASSDNVYQILSNDALVAQGKLGEKEHSAPEITTPDFKTEGSLSRKNFYRLCANEGYKYLTNFQVIQEVYVPEQPHLLYAQIDFNHWISFLDGLLQLSIVCKSKAGLQLPVYIRHIELSENKSDYVVLNKYTNSCQCGDLLVMGAQEHLLQRACADETILFLKETHFLLGKNSFPRIAVKEDEDLLAYAMSQFLLHQDKFVAPHQQRIKGIVEKYSVKSLPKEKKFASHSSQLARDFIRRVYQEPHLSGVEWSTYYHAEDHSILARDSEHIQSMLSVVRQNTQKPFIKLFEIGTGTGRFLKHARYALNSFDSIICTDTHTNRMVDDEVIKNLTINHYNFDINQEMSTELEEHLKDTDVVIAYHSFHLSHELQERLECFYRLMKPGAFLFITEYTSPYPLLLWGLDEGLWQFADERTFGPWTSLAHWNTLFEKTRFKLISALTSGHEFLTHFLIRKPLNEQYISVEPPQLTYDDEWADKIKNTNDSLLMYSNKPEGMAGFARVLNQEGKRVLSFCAPRQAKFIDEVKACGLVTNVVVDKKLATLSYIPQSKIVPITNTDAFHLEFNTPGQLDTFKYVKSKNHQGFLCQVAFAALNFRDVMLASGKINQDSLLGFSQLGSGFGLEFSGYHLHRPVMGIGLDTLANLVRTPFIWDVPEGMDLQSAASIPVAYLTVYYSFFIRAQLLKKNKVLIHGGAGSVGQAAIRVAHAIGCEIFTTCHHNKRNSLKELFPFLDEAHIGNSRSTEFEYQIMEQTRGKGVDFILNSLAEEKLQASLHCLAQHGTFIEIGKYDLMQNNPIGLKHFLSNITFCGIDIDQILGDIQVMEQLSSLLKDGLQQNIVQPTECTLFKWDNVPEAFRFLGNGKHVGKVLLDMRDALPQQVENRFYTAGAHLIVGGLGGIGMAFAEWLASRGAEHLILVSRNGVRNGEHQLFLHRLQSKYSQVQIDIVVKDFTLAEEVEQFVKSCPTLVGVYNLALILNDTLFTHMTKEKWEETVYPKALITQHLDQYTRDMNLQYFVCFSSIATQGNPGQSNYSFANNFMENICYARKKSGLAAMAIQWGAIGNIGVLTRQNESTIKMLENISSLQSIQSCLEYLEICLLNNETLNVVYHYPQKELNDRPIESLDLIAKISHILKIDLTTLPETTMLIELGLDSLQIAEIQAYISNVNQNAIPIFELGKLTIATLNELAQTNQGASRTPANTQQNTRSAVVLPEEENMKSLEQLALQHGIANNTLEELAHS